MSHMLQLNPSIPVEVINKGTGEADYLLWLVPNKEI